MVVPLVSPYLRWLQAGNPTGEVERYPELDAQGQSSVPGLYVVGDLTGIPLLKLAGESGFQVVKTFLQDPDFLKARNSFIKNKDGDHEIIVVGGGARRNFCRLNLSGGGSRLRFIGVFRTVSNH
jgi:hypothetical protein